MNEDNRSPSNYKCLDRGELEMIEFGNDGYPANVEYTQSIKNEVMMEMVEVEEDNNELDVQEDFLPKDIWGEGQEGLSE